MPVTRRMVDAMTFEGFVMHVAPEYGLECMYDYAHNVYIGHKHPKRIPVFSKFKAVAITGYSGSHYALRLKDKSYLEIIEDIALRYEIYHETAFGYKAEVMIILPEVVRPAIPKGNF